MRENKVTKVALAAYFVLFLVFLYGPMIVMAILSLQGSFGNITFPMRGFSGRWWQSLFDNSISQSNADVIRSSGERSLWLALAAGAIVALLALTLSMAFRRRFKLDGILFYVVMLALMTPGFLLSLGSALFWQAFGTLPTLWKTALGAHVVWGLPFGFLVMIAVWNRYDRGVEEAARDLGADARRTFREVTLPLIWTGVFGCFLFGFTLSWNEYDRTALIIGNNENTLPVQIFALTFGSVIRPDLYALGTATTLVSFAAIAIVLVVAAIRLRRRGKPAAAEDAAAQELAPEASAKVAAAVGVPVE